MSDERSQDEGRVRRVRMRRRGMSFSGGGMASASEGGGVADHPDNDHPDLDANSRVMERVARPPAPVQEAPAPSPQDGQDAGLQSISNREDFNPQERLRQVGRRSSEYEREYRLNLLHRLLMRKLPLDEIANTLGISVSQVLRDRAELRSRLRDAAKELNIDEMVGGNDEYYDEIAAMALRAASNAQIPIAMRLAGMRTALAARNDKHRFFQAAGVYDVLRFRRAPGGEGQSDIAKMLGLAEELMANGQRERREAGPDPLGEFSGGDSEQMEL